MVKHLSTMWETQVRSLGREDPLEKEMATHSSTIAWKIPWTAEPGRLQSMGLQRVRHDWATRLVGIGHSPGETRCKLPEFSRSGVIWDALNFSGKEFLWQGTWNVVNQGKVTGDLVPRVFTGDWSHMLPLAWHIPKSDSQKQNRYSAQRV